MAWTLFTHDATTTLASGITSGATSLTLTSGAGFPPAPFFLRIDSEVILVAAIAGASVTNMYRGQDGTAAAAHNAGAFVEHIVAASALNSFLQVDDVIQRGVIGTGDGKVTVASTTSVSIAAGWAWVPGLDGVGRRVAIPATTLSGIPVAVSGRLDEIYLDSNGTVARAQGTTDSGTVTLTSRTGFVSLAANTILLGDLLVTSGGAIAANLRDRRPWARGARHSARLAASATTVAASPGIAIDATNARRRLELSGAPVVVRWVGLIRNASAGADTGIALMMDGAVLRSFSATAPVANPNQPFVVEEQMGGVNATAVTPGSHLFDVNVYSPGGGAQTASTPGASSFEVIELVRQSGADNGTS